MPLPPSELLIAALVRASRLLRCRVPEVAMRAWVRRKMSRAVSGCADLGGPTRRRVTKTTSGLRKRVPDRFFDVSTCVVPYRGEAPTKRWPPCSRTSRESRFVSTRRKSAQACTLHCLSCPEAAANQQNLAYRNSSLTGRLCPRMRLRLGARRPAGCHGTWKHVAGNAGRWSSHDRHSRSKRYETGQVRLSV